MMSIYTSFNQSVLLTHKSDMFYLLFLVHHLLYSSIFTNQKRLLCKPIQHLQVKSKSFYDRREKRKTRQDDMLLRVLLSLLITLQLDPLKNKLNQNGCPKMPPTQGNRWCVIKKTNTSFVGTLSQPLTTDIQYFFTLVSHNSIAIYSNVTSSHKKPRVSS